MAAKRRTNKALPTGTVTFLFTDIEGSSRLWETQRVAMQLALTRHDALLRQCIEGHGGHVVKSVGDGVCAAFVSATDALEAAIAAQQALDAEPWPEPVRIRARMALHSGPAELRDGDYFGPTLNRVARLLALGHGGQTLVSATTHDICRHYLPPNVSLRSLGDHSLKDLERRESVFEVSHGELAKAFPPLRTMPIRIETDAPSVAVLPFVNMSDDLSNEYFADGLAEELLNVLSKIRGLRVSSRTSAFSFKGAKVDIPTVARKLNVAAILEGSVRKADNRVRITVQLVDVATDSHLWSETYDRELIDIFAVQDDIAKSVVQQLRSSLFGETSRASTNAQLVEEVSMASHGRSENVTAYQLFLQARFFLDRMSPGDVDKGVDLLRQALALEPGFALGWTELAHAYMEQSDSREDWDQAREAARHALELAPDLVEGHLTLASVLMHGYFDWKATGLAIERALELAPGHGDALRAASRLALALGQLDESVALSRQAVALDPLNVAEHRALAWRSLFAGRLDEAETAVLKAIDLSPSAGLLHLFLGRIRLAQGRPDEAMAAFKMEVIQGARIWGIAVAQHALGHTAESDAALEELIEKFGASQSYYAAGAYALRGEIDRALALLERAFAQRETALAYMRLDPLMRNLHADARWQPFLVKMGLAE